MALPLSRAAFHLALDAALNFFFRLDSTIIIKLPHNLSNLVQFWFKPYAFSRIYYDHKLY